MDLRARRDLLETTASTGARLDYLVSLEGRVIPENSDEDIVVSVRYIPDRLTLEPAAFGRYLTALGTDAWQSLEELGVTVLDDIMDQTVARWIQVGVRRGETGKGLAAHRVLVEDRQPSWDNPALLSRLPPP